MSRVGIVGGGIIGLSSAYYLKKAGFDVTIFDQSNMTDGCSFGNAGMIVPSHVIPLAAPGMIAKGLRWMFSSTSPFYVRPRLHGDLLRWGWHFYKNSTEAHVRRSIPALKQLSQFSKAMYQQLTKDLPFDFGYHERGLLMLYLHADTEKEEAETAHLANSAGIEAHILSLEEIQKMEPQVRVRARGGVYYPGDAHLNPAVFVKNLIAYLKDIGVQFCAGMEVLNLEIENGVVRALRTSTEEFQIDELIVAAGAWSGELCSQLGISLPMQAGKGYSFTLEDVEKNTQIPTIFLEARVAVTPMGKSLRFGGTMEITGVDHSINMNRVKGIVNSIPNYYPEMNVGMPAQETVWHGLRPCSPDGLPYIGRLVKIRNVVIATGHAMMGMSLGPGTGKLVSEILLGQKSEIDIAPFNPERFSR